jgi:2-C-methyl-D-erythritol 4-phosphate cytidylyltransferase
MRVAAIIPAAGRGERMGASISKALTPLLGRPLLAWTLDAVLDPGIISEIRVAEVLVAVPAEKKDSFARAVDISSDTDIPIRLITGGATRQESVERCLAEISDGIEIVAVHDAARPLMTAQIMLDTLKMASEAGAAIAAVPAKDTIKLCDGDGVVTETIDRSRAWLIQTPQCFRREVIVSAHDKARAEGYTATDDAALVERAGFAVRVVMGSYDNIKLTTPEDLMIVEEILRRKKSG